MSPRRDWDAIFRSLTTHPLGFAGVLLTSTSAVFFIILLVLDNLGYIENPYVGLVTFLVLPGLFVLGLVLTPLGRWLHARREKRGVVVDLSRPEHQTKLTILFGLTVVNVAILAVATYRGVEFTDSNTFCGKVCHQVMEPEYAAYVRSPHSRVHCVECHIGSGASFFVRYKINGLSQVIAVLTNSYDRPIETPVRNLRPARETCEQCHWPAKFHGDKLLVKTRYQEDEANTPLSTVMLLKVGGGTPESGFSYGIHRHASPTYKISYIAADPERQDIVWVEQESAGGETVVFTKDGEPVSDSLLAHGERRLLDCMDCHNRPTHIYQAPDEALDEEFVTGRLDARLPRLKKVGMELLTAEYGSKEEALEAIPSRLEAYYRENHPDALAERAPAVARAGETLREIYASNIFPSMKITWNTYPNQIGHREGGGCFRCHEGNHQSADGKPISDACETCHTLLAMEEERPEILKDLFPEE